MDDSIPPLPENWDRCHAYNARKRRYCRQVPVPLPPGNPPDADATVRRPPRYCGNHRHLLDEWLAAHGRCTPAGGGGGGESESKRPRTTKSQRRKAGRGRRIPCPVDPSHFIFESDVARHVLVCPAAKERREAAAKDYYREGINLGGFGAMGALCRECDDEGAVPDMKRAKKLASSVLRVFHHVFMSTDGCMVDKLDARVGGSASKVSEQQLRSITEKEIYDSLSTVDLSEVEEGTSDVRPNLALREVHNSTHETRHMDLTDSGRLTRSIAKHRIKAGGPRHVRQIASILGHVRRRGLISTDRASGKGKAPLVVEMGAGRGMTGLVVAGAAAASGGHLDPPPRASLHLVERSGTRGKAETKVRGAAGAPPAEGDDGDDRRPLRLDLVDVTRVKCDLAHVDMATALPPRTREGASTTVVVAKHLCGAGTDIALRSLRGIGTIDGCVMATCCHGLCSWGEYVGRDCFLRLFCGEVGGMSVFGEKEFDLLRRWTSASVLEERPTSGADPKMAPDENETKEEHYTESAEEKGRYPSIFTVAKELGLACGGKGLGRACQRLIDFGRCEYMRNNLFAPDSSPSHAKCFNVSMVHYVPRDVTPQNALLLASRD